MWLIGWRDNDYTKWTQIYLQLEIGRCTFSFCWAFCRVGDEICWACAVLFPAIDSVTKITIEGVRYGWLLKGQTYNEYKYMRVWNAWRRTKYTRIIGKRVYLSVWAEENISYPPPSVVEIGSADLSTVEIACFPAGFFFLINAHYDEWATQRWRHDVVRANGVANYPYRGVLHGVRPSRRR